MYNFHNQLTDFHNNYVSLNQSQQKEMRAKRAANLTRIRDGLEANGKPAFVEEIKQGGYKHKTMVQPPEAQPDLMYDIDNAIVFEAADADVTPRTARERVRAAIAKKGFGFKTQPAAKSKCVRVSYADGKQCDFPVLRRHELFLLSGHTYELAAGDEWVTRDSREISDWVEERVANLSPSETGSYQLRRIIRLMKFYGKTHAHANRHSFPGGIVMTALTVGHFVAKAERDDLAFRETLRAISTYAGTPVYAANELVSDAKDEDRIPRLREQAQKSVDELDKLDEQTVDDKEARKIWKKVFKHSYFSQDGVSKGVTAAAITGVAGSGAAADNNRSIDRYAKQRRESSGSIPPFSVDLE